MPSASDRSGAAARRAGLLDRVVQLGRRRRPFEGAASEPAEDYEGRIQALEKRIDHLEALLEGLQDAVHRESVRQGGRMDALEKKDEPAGMFGAVSRDTRRRGT